MAADNWARCPRCKVNREKELEQKKAKVEKAYGWVSAQVYETMRLDLEESNNQILNTQKSFREDYQVTGVEDGNITVTYSGSCRKCGLTIGFTDQHLIAGL